MKTIKFAAVASGLLVMLASANTFAQTSGAMAAPSTASAPSAKSVRMANRVLAKKVRQALTKAKPALPMQDITVLAKGGVVSLAGAVASEDQSTQASTVAQGVSGVTSVNNKLSIRQPGN